MENILKIEGYELLIQKFYKVLKTEIVKGHLKPGVKLFQWYQSQTHTEGHRLVCDNERKISA